MGRIEVEFQDLLDHQRKRYNDLVDAIVDGDCLPLVKYWGNNAPNVYVELSDLWWTTPTPILYSDAWWIMKTPWIAAFVLED